MNLDDVLGRLRALDPDTHKQVKADVMAATADLCWIPNPGPQTEAYFCEADWLLYGGQGGGGKSDMLAGLALTRHRRSLLLRYQYTDLSALVERVVDIAGTRRGLNSSPPPQFKHDGRVIDFGAASSLDKAQTWQGNPHDLIGLDEACQFPEAVVRFLLGWNRAADETLDKPSRQRVRAVLASNPPLSAEGQWIVGMFRPWLDRATYDSPAENGELRWFVTDPDGKDMEVDGPDDVKEWDGEPYLPKSRTFIPAQLGDNPFLVNTGYRATLDALPEPLRSAIRDGDFMASAEDDPWQVIPTAWILAAQARWTPGRPRGGMDALGVDVARGGRDQMILAPRYGEWFGEMVCRPGHEVPDGPTGAAFVMTELRDGAPVQCDVIGVGTSVVDSLSSNGVHVVPMNGSEKSDGRDVTGSMGFYNKRAEWHWRLRESLDPSSDEEIALPPDRELLADLASPKWKLTARGVQVESKDDIIDRLGRSPDKGDAVVYAHQTTPKRRVTQNLPTRTNSRNYNPIRRR